MAIKVMIIDDEPLAIEIVKNYLTDYPDIKIVATSDNGFDGFKAIMEKNPDLIFLDIQMPKISGFELLELLDNPPLIIFTTAYDQYALKAFEKNAVDYLLKPFSKERFDQAIRKALSSIENNTSTPEIEHLKKQMITEVKENLDRLVIKTGSRIKIIPIEEVVYFEAQDDYIAIHTQEGKYLKLLRMKQLESSLDASEFVRIHRSFIVNLNHISQVELMEKSSYLLILKNGQKIPVSRSGYTRLKEVLDF